MLPSYQTVFVNKIVAPAPVVSRAAPAPFIEYAALEPAVTYMALAPVNENVAASEMETAIQEVSDLLASMAKKKAKRKKR